MDYDDTIAAIATAPGEAGLAVVRLSGRDSRGILERVFKPRSRNPLLPRRLTYGWALEPGTEEPIDEVLAVSLPGPATFTGEDGAEIHCHGGHLSPARVLEATLRAGARLAEPGEFTLRAFLNGRLDLARAEAVLDLVQARTQRAHALALQGLSGRLSSAVRAIRADLLGPRAHLEASIDFSEEDLPPVEIRADLESSLERVRHLLAGADQGILYRRGARVAIVGRPNVGKSSLLNALLRSERAIVTPIAGTTRDTVEETASFQGIPFCLADTAGLHDSVDPVERIGVERSRAVLENADLALYVVDRSSVLSDDDRELIRDLSARPSIVVLNKCDLPGLVTRGHLGLERTGPPVVEISATRGDGLPELERLMVEQVLGGLPVADPAVSHPRHQALLRRAEAALVAALAADADRLPPDVVASEVAAAVIALGEITGENATEDLLDAIFSRFCIGK